MPCGFLFVIFAVGVCDCECCDSHLTAGVFKFGFLSELAVDCDVITHWCPLPRVVMVWVGSQPFDNGVVVGLRGLCRSSQLLCSVGSASVVSVRCPSFRSCYRWGVSMSMFFLAFLQALHSRDPLGLLYVLASSYACPLGQCVLLA